MGLRVAAVWALIWAGLTYSETESSFVQGHCPPAKQIEERLQEKQGILANTKGLLQGFLTGELSLAVTPSALFTVDLENKTAMEARRAQLNKLASQEGVVPEEYKALQECAQDDNLKSSLKTLLALENDVVQLRLKFFSLPESQRAELLKKYSSDTGKIHENTAKALSEAVNTVENEKADALNAKRKAQAVATKEKNTAKGSLATERVKLEETKLALSTIELEITKSLEASAIKRSQTFKEVKSLGNLLISSDSSSQLLAGYDQVSDIWRSVSLRTLDLFSESDVLLRLPEIPNRPNELLTQLNQNEDAKAFQESFESAQKLRSDLVSLQRERWEEEVERNYALLKQVSTTRSEFLVTLRELGENAPFSLSDNYFADFQRELILVPLRWRAIFYSKLVKIKSDLGRGFDGVFSLIKQGFSFLFILAIPFFLVFFSGKLKKSLDNYRENIVRSYRRTKGSLNTALWIQRINPYLTWIVTALAVLLADYFLKETVLEDFRTFIPYLFYYIAYKAFLQFLDTTFAKFALRSRSLTAKETKIRLHKTGRYVGTFFLLGICVLHATESTVSKALVFHFVKGFVVGLGIVLVAIAAFFWRKEISSAVPDYVQGKLASTLNSLLNGPFALVFSFPTLLLLIGVALFRLIWTQLSSFDVFKRLSAQLFRQKLESAASDKQETQKVPSLPADYEARFQGSETNNSSLISPQRDPLPKLVDIIEEWKTDPGEENSVAFVGEKGIGKTTVLHRLGASLSDVTVRTLSIPGGVIEAEKMTGLLASTLGLPEGSDMSALYKLDKELSKTVVLIDDTHNLFLASVGGFGAYRKFLEMINLPLTNIFWCATFNLHAWNYLKSVFKRNLFFRHTVLAESWTDDDIQQLILSRHRKSDYQLSYDDIIFATQSARTYETENYAETQFFRLLWEQSRGNPRGALHFWLSSLRRQGSSTFRVGLPEEPSAKGFQDLSIESLLVFASIVRHENLSVQEMVKTTEVPEGLVRQARKIGVERKFLERSESGRYPGNPRLAILNDKLFNQ